MRYSIIGPPGSGKTTTLISLLKYLTGHVVEADTVRAVRILGKDNKLEGAYHKGEVLFLTFSTSAEREILSRLMGVSEVPKKIVQKRKGWANHVRTIHSLAYGMIMSAGEDRGALPYDNDFAVARASFRKGNTFEKFAKQMGVQYDESGENLLVGNIAETVYSYAMNSISSSDIPKFSDGQRIFFDRVINYTVDVARTAPLVLNFRNEDVANIIKAYWNYKIHKAVGDYSEVLFRAVARNRYGLHTHSKLSQVRVLFVDEAQDLSPLQWAFVTKLLKTADLDVVIVAGDPLQSIYSFQGANPKIFLNFIKNSHAIVLDRSYRNPMTIKASAIDLARQEIIEMKRYGIVYDYAPRQELGEIYDHRIYTDEFEADMITRIAVRYFEPNKRTFILTRTNGQAEAIEQALYSLKYAARRIKIADSIYGRISDVWEAIQEVKKGGILDPPLAEKLVSLTVFERAVQEATKPQLEYRTLLKNLVFELLIGEFNPEDTIAYLRRNRTYRPLLMGADNFMSVVAKADSIRILSRITPKNLSSVLHAFITDPGAYLDFKLVSKEYSEKSAKMLKKLVLGRIVLRGVGDVRVDTFHASKGAEAHTNIIVDHLPSHLVSRVVGIPEVRAEETRLYYVAMTRTIERLVFIRTNKGFLERIGYQVIPTSSWAASSSRKQGAVAETS